MLKVKKHIPPALKRFIKISIQLVKDKFSSASFASYFTGTENLPVLTAISQHINPTATSKNKIHNLKIAIGRINNIEIKPGETFSFWKLVQKPTAARGFLKSRSIVNNELQEDIGGGLCQLSGLIYYLALQAGLAITERYAHSIDIYKEEERFTPLGSDATVAYGYKDLRFINNLPQPVYFTFEVSETLLTGSILSLATAPAHAISFEYIIKDAAIETITSSEFNGEKKILAKNNYKKNFT